MIKKISFLVLILFLLTACQNQSQKADEAELVKKTFEKYNSAILNDKGEEAVNYLDSRTLRYYADILEKVKKADEAALNSLSFTDKLQILRIRLTAKKEQILSFDDKEVIIFAVKNGMVGKEGVSNQSLGEITIEENVAKGQLVVKGKKTPFYLHFYKEDNQWKIDLTSLFPTSNAAFKKVIEESGMTENEYIIKLLEVVSKKKVGKEIWIPTEKLKS